MGMAEPLSHDCTLSPAFPRAPQCLPHPQPSAPQPAGVQLEPRVTLTPHPAPALCPAFGCLSSFVQVTPHLSLPISPALQPLPQLGFSGSEASTWVSNPGPVVCLLSPHSAQVPARRSGLHNVPPTLYLPFHPAELLPSGPPLTLPDRTVLSLQGSTSGGWVCSFQSLHLCSQCLAQRPVNDGDSVTPSGQEIASLTPQCPRMPPLQHS